MSKNTIVFEIAYKYERVKKIWKMWVPANSRRAAEHFFWHEFNNNRDDFLEKGGRPIIVSIKNSMAK